MSGWALESLPDVQSRPPRRSFGVVAGAALSLVLHGFLLLFLMLPAQPGVPRLLAPATVTEVTWFEFLAEPAVAPQPAPVLAPKPPDRREPSHPATASIVTASEARPRTTPDVIAVAGTANPESPDPGATTDAAPAAAASAATGTATTEATAPAAPARGYVWDVLAHLAPHQHYPANAQRRGHEGTVLVRARVSRRGVVLKAEIRDSSGHRSLDAAALALLTAASPLPPPPPGPTAITELDLPIVYALRPR